MSSLPYIWQILYIGLLKLWTSYFYKLYLCAMNYAVGPTAWLAIVPRPFWVGVCVSFSYIKLHDCGTGSGNWFKQFSKVWSVISFSCRMTVISYICHDIKWYNFTVDIVRKVLCWSFHASMLNTIISLVRLSPRVLLLWLSISKTCMHASH